MKYSTVIFDLDGTLLDTLGDLTDAVNAATAKFDIPPATESQIRQRVGNGIGNLIARSLPADASKEDMRDCLAHFRTHYDANMMNRTTIYEGISQTLHALKRAGLKIAVLSNKYDPAAKALVEHYFPHLVDLTLGERPNVERKPHPVSCLEILETLHESPANTLYIGDSAVDMATAKNAGLTSIGVTWGFCSREILAEGGADMLADRPYELISLILGLDLLRLEDAFRTRGFGFSYFETSAQAAAYLAKECAGKRVGFGGSMTLDQMGAFEAVSQSADCHWHWKGDAPVMDAEIYVTSANGLSATGEIVNIDGACNRIAASVWGANTCFVVCGINKLAPSLDTTISRARQVAGPRNAQRLNRHTPCAGDGVCHDCRSPERICRAMMVLMAPPIPMERYEVVLVGEILGY